MNHTEKAVNTFSQGFNCSQSVFSAFSDELGIDEKAAKKIGGCFGSGMRCGEVCGAVTGALMVIGLKYGHCNAEDTKSKAETNEKTLEMLNAFKAENGSILCRDLLEYDLSNPEELRLIKEKSLFTTICPKMVASAVDILDKKLDEWEE
ncbi:MAG: C-GCAxxG-C-C family protein [Methanocorpusculum sp.]|jgi:C_GCAxxG_C_C family probable redox protein|nr:C-GCAxxG-C-C family protein [Methanocorpusculum sp.]